MLLSKEMIFSINRKLCHLATGLFLYKKGDDMKGKYIDEYNRKEKLKENRIQKVIASHKCFRCEWSSWTGSKYLCMFGRCQK